MTPFVLLLALGLAMQAAGQQQWTPITQISTGSPSGVIVLEAGPPQRPFSRPPPKTLDPRVLVDFAESFNLMQDVSATGDNTFTDVSAQYVAIVPHGFVEGEVGMVYDAQGRVYHLPHLFHNRTNPTLPLPPRSPAQAVLGCTHRFQRMATVIQRYGHMYYHFLEETLPRVVALQEAGALTPDTKLLTWGKPYEAAWLALLGISQDQLVTYDPEELFCADSLLVPTPVPRITPPREALMSVRSALGVSSLPSYERDLIVYVSRAAEPTRQVANEAHLLNTIRTAFPSNPLVVFNGGLSPTQSIDLFQRARVVIGPHGAGLSHALFSAPGTALVEFLFMADPPMMFWHTSGALGLEYWLLPVPHSYYMQRSMEVPEGEVMDILTAGLGGTPPAGACKPGKSGRAGGLCSACPSGSYAFNANSPACKLCPEGRVATSPGSTSCQTCKPGTWSNPEATACLPCPAGTFSVLAGAGDVSQCLSGEQRRQRLEDQAFSVEMLSKLSPVFDRHVKRRALIQGGAPAALSQAELCAARAAALAATAGPYLSGPYTFDPTLCPPTTVPAPDTAPQETELPPINVPIPPEVLPANPISPPSPEDSTGRGDPAPETEQPFTKKKVLDTWVIALIATVLGLILAPLLVFLGIWLARRRHRSRMARAAAAGAASAAGNRGEKPLRSQFAVTNPTFDLKASSSSGTGASASPTP